VKKQMSPWEKKVRCRLVELEMTVNSLADKTGMARVYTSAVVNERVISAPAREKINRVLGIEDDAESSQI